MGDNVLQVANCGGPSCETVEVAAQRQAGLGNPVVAALARVGNVDGTTALNAPPGMALLSLHQTPMQCIPTLHPLVLMSSHAV